MKVVLFIGFSEIRCGYVVLFDHSTLYDHFTPPETLDKLNLVLLFKLTFPSSVTVSWQVDSWQGCADVGNVTLLLATCTATVSATTSSARGDAVTVLAMIAGSSCASTPAYDFKQISKKTLGPLFLHHISSQNLHIARSICLAVKEEAHSEQMDSGS